MVSTSAPDDGAEHRGHAAEHHHDHQLDRVQERRLGRRDEAGVVRHQRAGHRGEHRRDHEHAQLVARGVDAQRLRRGLASRAARAARGRRGDSIRLSASHTAQQQRATDHPVPGALALQRPAGHDQRRHRHAVGPAGDLVLGGQHDRDDDAQPERGHRQVVALQPQDRPPDHVGQQSRPPACWPAATPRWASRSCAAQDRRAVAAEREEAGVAEADLPGIADQQVEPDADDRVERRPGSRPRRSSCWSAAAAAPRSSAPARAARRCAAAASARSDQSYARACAPLAARARPRLDTSIRATEQASGMKNSTARMITNAIASL